MKKILIIDISDTERMKEMRTPFIQLINEEIDIDLYKIGEISNTFRFLKFDSNTGNDRNCEDLDINFDMIFAHITDYYDPNKQILREIKYKLIVFYGGNNYGKQRQIAGSENYLINRTVFKGGYLDKKEVIDLLDFFDNGLPKDNLPSILLPCDMKLNELYTLFWEARKNENSELEKEYKASLKTYADRQ